MPIYWTKIDNHPLAQFAWMTMDQNEKDGCLYHNRVHLLEMYEYLHNTNEPYHDALDWAIMFHDIVYDQHPHKEIRSEQLWKQKVHEFPELTHLANDVVDLISATINHDQMSTVEPLKSAIIRADLHGLSNVVTAFENYYKILHESINLYNIDHLVFAKNNLEFMIGLYNRVQEHKILDIEYEDFYLDVLNGIDYTMMLSELLLEHY